MMRFRQFLCCNFVNLLLLPAVLDAQGWHFEEAELPRVAIIGAGIGGSTAAYKLKRAFGSELPLDVYEQNEVGGRLRTITLNGVEYEAGGAVIHPSNEHMNGFVDLLGLEKLVSSGGDNMALFNGQHKLFETSKNSLVSTLQLLWRYGFSLFAMEKHTNGFLTDFERIYKWQDEQQCFTTLPNLLMAMSDDIMNATKVTLTQLLLSKGISQQLIDELAMVATRCNYGQQPSIMHGLVGSVSLAGVQGGLWSVKGGNHRVPEGLLKKSGTKVTKATVTKVTNITTDAAKPLYKLETSDGSSKEYDVVVLAAPLSQQQLLVQFSGFDTDINAYAVPYHPIKAYIVEGTPNYKYFGYQSLQDMPDNIFPVGKDEFYSSLNEIYPVSGETTSKRVWKVFSNEDLTQEQLDMLFLSRDAMELVKWYAFPQYKADADFVPFVLAPKLYYVNTIELAASAMEMSAIGGTNAARLVVNQWTAQDHFVDNMFVIEEKHIKLEL